MLVNAVSNREICLRNSSSRCCSSSCLCCSSPAASLTDWLLTSVATRATIMVRAVTQAITIARVGPPRYDAGTSIAGLGCNVIAATAAK